MSHMPPAVDLPDLQRPRKWCLLLGIAACVVFSVGAFTVGPRQFFHSYFMGFIICFNITLGCLAILMLQHLTGGVWGLFTRRILETATRTLPLVLLMFIPVLVGMRWLYVWTDADLVSHDKILQHKSLYLNPPFFVVRAAAFFVIWGGLAFLLNRWSHAQDKTADPRLSQRMSALSAPGVIFYGLTATFVSIDWVMSMEPHWHSTIFCPLFAVGQMLGGFAFTVLISSLLLRSGGRNAYFGPRVFQDLGSLMLAFVLLWAYMAFAQFLLIWMANKKDEVPWYLDRFSKGWQGFAITLVLLHFALPFFLLLLRDVKRYPKRIATVACAILLMRFVDLEWVIIPSYDRSRVVFAFLDLLAVVGLGGIWLAVFLWQLGKRPLLPQSDPYLEEALEYGRQ